MDGKCNWPVLCPYVWICRYSDTLQEDTYFSGQFEAGLRSGNGLEFLNGSLVFDGGYADDKREGFGIEYYPRVATINGMLICVNGNLFATA